MEIHKICSFFGHREIEVTEELVKELKLKIEDLIVNESVGIFYFGGFGMFDDLCWQVVTELKLKYAHIKRIFCLSNPRHLRVNKRPKNLKREDYEEFVYLDLDFDWWYQRIYYRNVEMINQSDFVIFYVKNTSNSGAYKAYQYAVKKKKKIINIVNFASENGTSIRKF